MSKKDAFYFPHFYNARHDRKIRRIRKELGIEGYGIYFMLLEVLREQTDFRFPLEDIDLLADEFGTSQQKVSTVIGKYDLFSIDEDKSFFSLKLVFYLQPYLEKSQRARDAAKIRWNSVKEDANVMQMHSKCNADQNASKVKERRVKERKDTYSAFFDILWTAFPNKLGKAKAEKNFNCSVKTEKDLKDIKVALNNYQSHLAEEANKWKKAQNGSTWFNGWRDWIDYVPLEKEVMYRNLGGK